MNFEKNIQNWVNVDNQIKTLNDKLKELKETKQTLSHQINNHVETSNLTNVSVKINDGLLKFISLKEAQPLTYKYLETCLSEIIKNEEQVKKIIEYIKNKREIKIVPEIKRIYKN